MQIEADVKGGDIKIPDEYYDLNDSDQKCFVCENPKFTPLYSPVHYGFPFTFKQCQCGLIKQTPLPNQKFFNWFFNSDLFFKSKSRTNEKIWGFYDYFNDEPCRVATSKKRYQKFSSFLEKKKPLKILKIGPSTGSFLWVANQKGHEAIGCDISSKFVAYAKEHYNVHIDEGRFENLEYPNKHFDVILLFNVIENIPNQVQFITEVRKKLKNNGLFIFNYVNMKNNFISKIQKDKYFLFRPPICYIFTKNLIQKFLLKFGFQYLKSLNDVRYLNLEKIFSLLGMKIPLKIAELLKISKIPFPIYAYPSKIVISQKKESQK